MIRVLPVWLLVLAATAAESPSRVRLLAIGNSFSNNALKFLPAIAKAGGCELEVEHLMVGGSPLSLHWKRHEINRTDPADPAGRYGDKGTKPGLAECLARQTWDVATIQQYSLIAHDPAGYRPFAANLVEAIRAKSPQARILIHQTWAYRCDDPRFGPGKEMADASAMHRLVKAAYTGIAAELKIERIPVGDAFQLVAEDPTWAFKPDTVWKAAGAQEPSLPDQTHSLHAGWGWRKDKDGKVALRLDGHHAGPNGEYLAGCVWYEVLFRRSPIGIAFRPPGMDEAYAAALRRFAHQAVQAAGAAR